MRRSSSIASTRATKADLEKEIFDLKNLLEISRSLSSTLDYHLLNDSILYTCLGALTVAKAAFFSKRTIDATDFTLHRDFLGFEIDHRHHYNISEVGSLVAYLNQHDGCHDPASLKRVLPPSKDLEVLFSIEPSLVVPLKAKGNVNGLLVLGEKIGGEAFSARDHEYLGSLAGLAATAVHNAYLFEMTTTDMMTKLKLKHFFVHTLGQKVRDLAPPHDALCLVMADIDHFKNVNDTHGHLAGDEILKAVAAIVLDNVRTIDTAARYGGEEFIVMLPGLGVGKAFEVAERIRKKVESSPFPTHREPVPVTISLGVAEFDPVLDATVADFIERVDQALYASKQAGRNRTSLAQGAIPP